MGLFDTLFGRGSQINPSTATTRRFGIPSVDKLRLESGTAAFPSLAQRATQAALGQDRSFGGFGPDFVSQATNPVIAARRAELREQTIPDIAAAASARGLGRSSIATGQIADASTEAARDIDQLRANFFVLNEAQRKKDIAQGLGIGERGLQFQLGADAARAAIDTSDLSRNLKVQQANQSAEDAATARLLQTALTGAGLAAGAGTGTAATTLPFNVPQLAGSQRQDNVFEALARQATGQPAGVAGIVEALQNASRGDRTEDLLAAAGIRKRLNQTFDFFGQNP